MNLFLSPNARNLFMSVNKQNFSSEIIKKKLKMKDKYLWSSAMFGERKMCTRRSTRFFNEQVVVSTTGINFPGRFLYCDAC